jgi:hypothetical protein
MTSEGLGEVFKGYSADTCAGKFPLVSMGGQANGQACAEGEQGPPSARAEIFGMQPYFDPTGKTISKRKRMTTSIFFKRKTTK